MAPTLRARDRMTPDYSRRIALRILAWADLVGAVVWGRFWCDAGFRCPLCGRDCELPAAEVRFHRLSDVEGSPSALLESVLRAPITPDEIWYARCLACPTPTTDAELEFLEAQVRRLATLTADSIN